MGYIVEKEKAIQLRREGRTYSEILAQIPIAKSTLSEWLKSVQLATAQKQAITKKRQDSALRGAQKRRYMRLEEIQKFIDSGQKEIGKLTKRELWLIGTALHWAEGSKQKETAVSTGIIFNNSDMNMVRVYLSWLQLLNVDDSDIEFELYVHDTRRLESLVFREWWARELKIPLSKLNKVYIKKGNPKTNRTNTADLYHGLIRIRVRSSTILNRKVNGWIAGIVQHCQIV